MAGGQTSINFANAKLFYLSVHDVRYCISES